MKNKKLVLKKEVIAKLNGEEMNQLKGGALWTLIHCGGTKAAVCVTNNETCPPLTSPSEGGCPTTNDPTMAC